MYVSICVYICVCLYEYICICTYIYRVTPRHALRVGCGSIYAVITYAS